MSRTYKDYTKKARKWHDTYEKVYVGEGIRYKYNLQTHEPVAVGTYPRFILLEKAGVLEKQKRNDYDFVYYNRYARTPSWWIREFMTIPKRQKCRIWEENVVKTLDLEDLEDLEDCPDYGNKPHKYYW